MPDKSKRLIIEYTPHTQEKEEIPEKPKQDKRVSRALYLQEELNRLKKEKTGILDKVKSHPISQRLVEAEKENKGVEDEIAQLKTARILKESRVYDLTKEGELIKAQIAELEEEHTELFKQARDIQKEINEIDYDIDKKEQASKCNGAYQEYRRLQKQLTTVKHQSEKHIREIDRKIEKAEQRLADHLKTIPAEVLEKSKTVACEECSDTGLIEYPQPVGVKYSCPECRDDTTGSDNAKTEGKTGREINADLEHNPAESETTTPANSEIQERGEAESSG
jgi:hypothetical protein